MWGDAFNAQNLGATTELQFNSVNANNVVTFNNPLTLSTGNHIVRVTDNTTTGDDWAVMSGTLSGAGGLSKIGNGLLIVTGNNGFTGSVSINGGALRVASLATNLNFAANNITLTAPNGTVNVLETAGTLNVNLGAAVGSIKMNGSGGFSAGGGNLSVTLNSNAALTWNSTSNFTLTGHELQFNSAFSDGVVTLNNDLALGTTGRSIRVTDNAFVNTDYAVISGVISGGSTASSIIKSGNGILVLAGVNTFTGGLSITGGALRGDAVTGLRINAATNPVRTSFRSAANAGGVLETSGSLTNNLGTGAGNIQWGPSGTINGTTGGSGGFSAFGGPLNVTLNNNSSTPLVWGTTANFTATNAEMAFGSVLSDNVVTFNNPVNLGDAARVIRVTGNPDTPADYTLFTGVLSSTVPASGFLNKAGTGTLVLTADATYSGTTTVSGGTLRLGNGGTTGNLIGNIRLTNSTAANPINLVYHHSSIVPVAGVVSGNGAVTITGASTGGVLYNAANTYTGTTTLAAGTLRVGIAGNAIGALYSNAGTTVDLNGFSLGLAGLFDDTTGPGYVINGGATASVLTLSGGNFTGTFSESGGSIALVKLGAGTLTLGGGANNYSGGLTLGGTGLLYIPNLSYLGSGPLRLNGGTLQNDVVQTFTNAVSFGGAVTFSGAQNLTLSPASANFTVDANTTLTNSIGPGGVTLNGNIQLINGNFQLTGVNPIVLNGNIEVMAATHILTNFITGQSLNSINLSADGTARQLDIRGVNTNTLTINGVISDGGLGGTMRYVSGINVINGSNTYSGTTHLFGGSTSVLGSDAAFGTSTVVTTSLSSIPTVTIEGTALRTLANNITLSTTLVLGGSNDFILNGTITTSNSRTLLLGTPITTTINGNVVLGNTAAGVLTLSSAAGGTFMVAGTIQDGAVTPGALTINMSGGGTAAITGSNSYTGITILTAGTLIMGHDNAFSTGTLRLNGGTFDAGVATRTLSNPLAFGGTVTLTGGGGIIANNAAPTTVSGATVLTLSNAGTLVLNNGLTTAANLTLTQGGALVVHGPTVVSAATVLTMSNTSVTLGTLRLGANLSLAGGTAPTIGGVLSLTGGSRTLTVNNVGGVTLNNVDLSADAVVNRVLTLAGAGPIVVNGAISDGGTAGGVAVAGGADVTFNGTNTYTLRTTISNGTLRLGTTYANALGLAPLVFGAASGTRAVLETSGTLTNSVGTLANQVQWIGAGGFSAKGGALNVTLNDDAGTPIIWTAAGIGTQEMQFSSPTADNTVTLMNSIDVSNTMRTIRVFDGSAAVDAVISGVILSTTTTTGGIVKQGPGTLALTAVNTFTGGVTLAGGTLKIGNGGATGSLASQVVTSAGSTVWFDRTGDVAQGTISGTGDLRVTVTGATMTLTNFNNTGLSTIASGTLMVGNTRTSQFSATNIVVDPGAVLRLSTTSSLTNSATISGGGRMIIAPGATNAGTFTYLGTSTLSGSTMLTGTVGTLFIGDGATSGSGSISGDLNISGSSSVIAFNRPDDYTYAGAISYTAAAGSAQVRKLTNSTLTLSGVSTYTNATSIAAGTVVVTGALGNTPITIAGNATLDVFTGATVGNTSGTVTVLNNGNIVIRGTMGAGTGTLNANATLRGIGGTSGGTWNIDGGVVELGGVSTGTISSLHLGGMNVIGAGATFNLDLDAPATSSSSLVNLQTSIGDRLTFANLPTIGGGTIFNLFGNTNTTAGYYLMMSGYAGTINFGAFAPTVNAPVGFGKQVFNQAGMFFVQLTTVSTLTWDGSIAGAAWDDNITTNFNGGTVAYSNTARDSVIFDDSAVGSTSVNIVGPLDPSGVFVNNTALTYTFNGGAIAGDTGLNKAGAGLLTLLNPNTFTGPLNIIGGTVQIGAGGSLGAIGATTPVTLDNGAALRVNRNDSYTIGGNISGVGSLEQAGTGTLVLTGNNSFVGATTINGGTLSIQGTGVFTDLSPVTVNSGTFGINGSVAQVIQSITVNGGGDLRINSGAFTATTLNVNGGQVNVGAALSVPTYTQLSGTLNVTGANATLTTATFGGVLSDTTGGAAAVINVANTRVLTFTSNITFTANNTAATDQFGLVINGPGSISTGGAARTWTINDSANAVNDVTISAPISAATSAFNKAGAGTLYLQGTNASTATNTLSAGTLVIGNNSALGTGAIVFGNATLMADGSPRTLANASFLFGTTVISGTQDLILSGIMTNSGGNRILNVNNSGNTTIGTLRFSEGTTNRAVTIGGTGNVIINNLSQNTSTSGQLIVFGTGVTVNLPNSSTYTGTTFVRNGTLLIGHADSLGVGGTVPVFTGTTTVGVNAALLTSAGIVLTRDVNVVASGAGSTITLGAGGAHQSVFGGNVTLNQSAFLTAPTSGTATFAGNLTGAGGITKVGGGVVILSGAANTYAGAVGVAEGILAVTNATALGTTTAVNITPTSAGANPGLVTAGSFTLTQNINVSDAQISTVVLGGATAETSTFSGNITFSQNLNLYAATSGTVFFTGTLDDGGSFVGNVTKEGGGAVVLLGTNAWTGLTTINAGILSSTNSLAGAVHVNTGGTFTGLGASGSTVFNHGGSVIYIGNQTGTTEVTGGTVNVGTGSEVSGLVTLSGGTLTRGQRRHGLRNGQRQRRYLQRQRRQLGHGYHRPELRHRQHQQRRLLHEPSDPRQRRVVQRQRRRHRHEQFRHRRQQRWYVQRQRRYGPR